MTTVYKFSEGDRVVTTYAEYARYEVPWGMEPNPEQVGTITKVGVIGAYVVFPDGVRLDLALHDLRPAPPLVDDDLVAAFFRLTSQAVSEDVRISEVECVLDFIAGLAPMAGAQLRAELGLHKPLVVA